MQIAQYTTIVAGREVDEIGTEAYLDAGCLANMGNAARDKAAMAAAARVGSRAFAEFEARYGFAPHALDVTHF